MRAAGRWRASSSRAPSSSSWTIPTGTTTRPSSRAFAREGDGQAPGLLTAFLGELEERVASAPDRYRRDYIEALLVCRKVA
jgi:hypothetical protein